MTENDVSDHGTRREPIGGSILITALWESASEEAENHYLSLLFGVSDTPVGIVTERWQLFDCGNT
jgi:hypothetical protein